MSMNDDHFLIRCIAIAVLLSCPAGGLAQDQRPTVNTLFGPRAIGVAINPGVRSFNGGVRTGPGGNFLGVGRSSGVTLNPWSGRAAEALGSSEYSNPQTGIQIAPQMGSQAAVQDGTEMNPSGGLPSDAVTELNSPDVAIETTTTASPSLAAPPPRIRYDLGGSQPATAAVTRLADRIQRNPHVHCRSPITVVVRDGTTILMGRVAAEHDRRVAEMLAHLEPGVGRVKNELSVPSPSKGSSSSAPPR